MDIKLKKWELSDKESLMTICNSVDRNYLSDRLPYPYTESSAKWWLKMVLEHEGKDGIFRAIVVNDEIVGNISVEQKNDVYRKDAEIGYFLLTQQWSKGIMTNAVKQICELAFRELDIIRITGLVYESNTASKRVLEKNGFVEEGVMKNAVIKNDILYDLCIFGKLKLSMKSDIQKSLEIYKEQLGYGHIQTAYTVLMKYTSELRSSFPKEYRTGNISFGYLDYTYFPFFNEYLRSHKLRFGMVLNHEKMRFELWLMGQNADVQKKYWMLLKESQWNKDRKEMPKYSVLEVVLENRIDFTDKENMSKNIVSRAVQLSLEIQKYLESMEN